MSIVAISETVGSGGTEIGRALASALGWEFADREIITKAAESFGEGVLDVRHAIEEKPTLWDRFRQSQRRYMTYVEAIVLEMAARDRVVLVGRASTVILGDVAHALRVRVIAPEHVRAERMEREQGLTGEAARDYVRDTDRDLAARVRFLYHLDWDAPLLYDVVINTERTSVRRAVAMLRERLLDDRLAPTDASRQALRERSLGALARAALLANPATRPRAIGVSVADGSVELTGRVESEAERRAAEETVARIPGVAGVRNELVVVVGTENLLAHGQFRHGEERSWGGYGGGSYERQHPEAPRPEDERRP
ncbi:MAG: BON domain-containing protein [Candidatus Rokuibacteriota bacterium]|nr:MAG: BON domain-containing protein [Candidatus Rokubacteria bacterium]